MTSGRFWATSLANCSESLLFSTSMSRSLAVSFDNWVKRSDSRGEFADARGFEERRVYKVSNCASLYYKIPLQKYLLGSLEDMEWEEGWNMFH